MPVNVNVKALGLNFQSNPLELPPGSLLEASNVIIRRDDIVESRRGYKIYGESFGSASDRAKQLATYKGRILRHFSSTLEFDTGTTDTSDVEQFSAFSGSYSEVQSGLRIKYIESNGNFYYTTSEGIKKISVSSASDLSTSSGFITQSGGVKALDVTANVNYNYTSQIDFFAADSVVAYRWIWGLRDSNNNLILGAPSQREEIYNSLLTLMLQDYMKMLLALDNINVTGCLINDGNYVNTLKLGIGASSTDIYTNLQSLASKLDANIVYANDSGTDSGGNSILNISATSAPTTSTMRITVSAGNPTNYLTIGSKVILSGFGAGGTSGTSPNGARVVAGVAAGYFDVTVASLNVADTFAFTSGVVTSNEYGTLTVPSAPSIPTTNQELVAIQTYLNDIILRLQSENTYVIPSGSMSAYITPLDITTSSTVTLTSRIPDGVTSNHFYQLYRTSVNSATGVTVLSDLSAGDEMQLVFEGFPTAAELSAKEVTIEDVTPDSFRGAYLYTNPTSGEGILQANDNIPLAKDINKFKNYTFYANTRTRHFELLNLLGVSEMIADYNLSTTPKLTITNGTTTNTYSFIVGVKEKTKVTCVADVADSLNGKYFVINSADDATSYYVWYKTSGGAVSDPAVSGKTGLRVNIATGATASSIASKTRDVLNSVNADFSASVSSADITVENVAVGYTTNASAGTSGFTVTVLTQGKGENVANKEVLLSPAVSPAQAVDETARSFVRVINKNSSESNYAYYISGPLDVPGKMQIEAKNLDNTSIYFLANNSNTGSSFNPDISPSLVISSNTMANPTVVTTSSAHGLINQDKVVICNSNSTPSIDGLYQITYISSTQFSINVNVTVAGTSGALSKSTDVEQSTNDNKPHRIYYSKLQQPEAVPIVNYIEVGAADEEILRILPLRDSLFIFKERGLYRLSGEVSPFSVALFDSSCNLLAPDSLAVVNNVIYGWTNAGISAISEAGVSGAVSRPIDTDILKKATAQFTSFKTATWGIGYESDNSYTVYTVKNPSDDSANIGYRYCTLTYSWSTFDKEATCGVINPLDDRMYLGAGDINDIEQERKDFTRYDYADREYNRTLTIGNYFGDTLSLGTIENMSVGDVVTQEQLLTIYEYNMLLHKLDIDTGVNDTNYYSSLKLSGGVSLKTGLLDLATKLDSDSGVSQTDFNSTIVQKTGSITANTAASPTVITSASHGLFTGRAVTISGSNCTPSINGVYQVTVIDANTFSIAVNVTVPGTAGSWTTLDSDFRDIQACYNKIISKLNLDSGVSFSNYKLNNTSSVREAVITAIDSVTKKITLNNTLDFVTGAMKVYNAINCQIVYAPQTMGDALSLKQIREATMLFLSKAFTNATLSFASDLVPQYYDIEFEGDGVGIFGSQSFGSNFFGGASNSVPFRTYVPANSQRCRYLVVKFNHKVAREQFGITGLTLVGEITSTRAYR